MVKWNLRGCGLRVAAQMPSACVPIGCTLRSKGLQGCPSPIAAPQMICKIDNISSLVYLSRVTSSMLFGSYASSVPEYCWAPSRLQKGASGCNLAVGCDAGRFRRRRRACSTARSSS